MIKHAALCFLLSIGSAHAEMECATLLKAHVNARQVTATLVPEAVEIRGWTLADMLAHLNRPLTYRYVQYTTFRSVEVGPIVFNLLSALPHAHRQTAAALTAHYKRPHVLKVARSFLTEARRKEELALLEQSSNDTLRTPSAQVALALLRDPALWRANEEKLLEDGVESGQWLIRLKNGLTRKSKLFTNFSAVRLGVLHPIDAALKQFRIPMDEIEDISLIHVHPGRLINASALSLADLEQMNYFVKYFAALKLYPAVHIYAIAPGAGAPVACHFGIRGKP